MPDSSDAHTAVTPLKGRRALITGGTTGIGRATAILLASEGARVFVCGRDPDHLADALAAIRKVGDGDGIALDLAEGDAVDRFLNAGEQALGGFDIVIANAAIGSEGVTEQTREEMRYAIATNFTAYLETVQGAAARMDAGDIVMTGSMSTYALGPHSTVYAGIKYGIQGLSVALRRELGPKGIRVALVEPSLTGSDMVDGSPEEQAERIDKDEMLRAEDIAVGIHYILTQPRRTVIQRLDIAPRMMVDE